MGKAYSDEQRTRVRALLEAGRDEEGIEKETGVSDRTIRRWKLELERTGRIGKPPESRTGRHRVLTAEVESNKPDMSVDDMLWWLYDNYKIVVGTRTIRRVFERKGDKKPAKSRATASRSAFEVEREDHGSEQMAPGPTDDAPHGHAADPQLDPQYQSPYAPVPTPTANSEIEQQLRQAMQQETPPHPYPALMDLNGELPEDEETIQLQLHQIALERRAVELRLKMRKAQAAKMTPTSNRVAPSSPQSTPSSLFNPTSAMAPTPPKRDSRSKKKIAESRQRTADRQERMLRDLERRSRRRDHLTAEWVQSKDIWPLRAQRLLADLMHQYGCYSYSPNHEATFDVIFRELYQLVDLSKGDWDPRVHDEMLRERAKRKMGQLRTKMQKTGEIVARADGYPGFQRADDYTGETAGEAVGDESEMVQDPALHAAEALQAQAQAGAAVSPQMQAHAPLPPDEQQQQQAQQQQSQQQHLQHHYDSVPPDQQMQPANMAYPTPIMHHQGPPQQYAMMDQHQHMLPYGQMGSQQSLPHQDGMVL